MRHIPIILAALALTACSADYEASLDRLDTADWGPDADEDDSGAWEEDPEVDRLLLSPPAALPTAVFVANAARDTVTRIDVFNQDIRTVGVGTDPERLWTSVPLGAALTLNRGDDTVSVVDATTLDVSAIAVRPDMNTLSMSPSGSYAVAWTDMSGELAPNPGVQAFNELTVVDLIASASSSLAVGFNPEQVRFTPDDGAVVVGGGWLAFLDLADPYDSLQLLPLADEPDLAPAAREIVATADGDRFLIRQHGAAGLLVVDRAELTVDTLPFDTAPTDMEPLSGDRAAVLFPAERSVVVLDLWGVDAPVVYTWAEDHQFSGLDATDEGLVLHSTSQARYGWLPLDTGELVVRSLAKTTQGVALVDGSRIALFSHPHTNVDVDADSPFYGRDAVSMVRLSDGLANPMTLDAALSDVVDTGLGYGFFTIEGESVLAVLDYTTLLTTTYPLASVPETLGVVPGTTEAYASLTHDLGRITFYDPSTGEMQTITGFELNSAIDSE